MATVLSLCRDLVEEPGGGVHLMGTLRGSWSALEMEHLSLWELCQGNLQWGLLYWGPRRISKGKLWRCASLSMGALLGNLYGGSFTRDLRIEGCSGNTASLYGNSVRSSWRRGFTGDPEGYVQAGSGNGHLSSQGLTCF
jgi:hypothetical protein